MGSTSRFAVMHANVHTATPLLNFIAGSHADRIAKLWPAPHEGFLTLPTARRHAAAMVLSNMPTYKSEDIKRFTRWLSRERDAKIASAISRDAGPALVKTLSKLGEVLWAEEDYKQFLQAFNEANANRVLRHMTSITPDAFGPIAELPSVLREASVIRFLPTIGHARILAQAYDLVRRTRGQSAAQTVTKRWIKAKSQAALFDKAAMDVMPDAFAHSIDIPELPAPFRRIESATELRAVALEFENCLRDFLEDIARGRMAVYIWNDIPEAAIALTLDPAGWRLAEAEGKKNEPLPEHSLRKIVTAVTAQGIRTGPAVGTIIRRLNNCRDNNRYQEEIGPSFVDRLELGDLWA